DLRLFDVPAQLDWAIGQIEIPEWSTDISRRDAEHYLRLPVCHGDQSIGAHDYLRGRAGEEGLVAHVVKAEDLVASGHRIRIGEVRRGRRGSLADLLEYPSLEVDRCKHPRVTEQHFGLAQEKQTVIGEREVEPTKDSGLRLGIEIHEGIAAHKQVDPRDRS